MEASLLTYLIFIPLAGAVVIALVGKDRNNLSRWLALGVSLLNFIVSIPVFTSFDATTPAMQFVQRFDWVKSLGISYSVGIDGISVLLVMITTLLTVLAILGSWASVTSRVREYMVSMLLLETGMLGVFCSLDLFLFYVFWEAMLIPMYLLIGVWGGERRIYAAMKFVLFTLAGSLLMLVAIIYLYFQHGLATGNYTFDLLALYDYSLATNTQYWLFLAFFLSFAIKVPLFPLHTWLPDAHVEAPTAGSVILAGVLLKMGTYGILRFCMPLFPSATAHFTPTIMLLSVIGIVYGALVAMVQTDIKKLVAYSSVSHLGFVVLGMFAMNEQGMQGSIIQMVNHGISTGALFLIVGMIYERRHTREIEDFGGLAKVIPGFSVVFMLATLSSIGLPGLNGFVGEFLILLGAYQASTLLGVIATSGVVLSAVYMLWMFQRVVWGEVKHDANAKLKDLSVREWIVIMPLVILMIWIGVYSQPFMKRTEVSSKHLIQTVQSKQLRGYGQAVTLSDQTPALIDAK
ncbi:MAG TPA: NADH-quinone oxidoreductase subunit M [Candidatus Latescibacteria bacterium]|nr:NADH-quinone oxidoreductase subunit M [Candidatus Latescibacterota bacterium]